ncbi:unnamed protein product [Gadus morhua 'NCC']
MQTESAATGPATRPTAPCSSINSIHPTSTPAPYSTPPPLSVGVRRGACAPPPPPAAPYSTRLAPWRGAEPVLQQPPTNWDNKRCVHFGSNYTL